jgi:SOUL heme-binding protein
MVYFAVQGLQCWFTVVPRGVGFGQWFRKSRNSYMMKNPPWPVQKGAPKYCCCKKPNCLAAFRRSVVATSAVPFCLLMFALPMTSRATEEPDYKLIQKLDEIEVREYAAYTVAEVVIAATAADAGNLAFPILAGYIFGKNKGER